MSAAKTNPCENCPFRKTIAPAMRDRRFQEIAEGESFFCHKTVDYSDDTDGRVTSDSKLCAGWIGFTTKKGMEPNAVRVAIRLGILEESHCQRLARHRGIISEIPK